MSTIECECGITFETHRCPGLDCQKQHPDELTEATALLELFRETGLQPALERRHNYKKNPAAMLRARCKSSAGRAAFPGATCGLYCPEEMDQ